MIQNHLRFFLAAAILAAAAFLPAHAWVAAGPRGVAAGGWGGGVAYGHYGGAVAWNRGGYYRPPVAVIRGGYYGGYSGGEVAAAAVAGLAVGAMAGAAVASANSAPPPAYYQAPAYPSPMPYGTQVTILPGNCGSAMVGNVEFYQCGPNWFKPYFGNSSVYYQVVLPPY